MRDDILSALKGGAWERAKGELYSLSAMSLPKEKGGTDDLKEWYRKCDKRRELIENFIREMEEDELHLN